MKKLIFLFIITLLVGCSTTEGGGIRGADTEAIVLEAKDVDIFITDKRRLNRDELIVKVDVPEFPYSIQLHHKRFTNRDLLNVFNHRFNLVQGEWLVSIEVVVLKSIQYYSTNYVDEREIVVAKLLIKKSEKDKECEGIHEVREEVNSKYISAKYMDKMLKRALAKSFYLALGKCS